MHRDYNSQPQVKEKHRTPFVIALLVSFLAPLSSSCPAHLEDVNVEDAVASGVEFSFVVWKGDLPRHLTAGTTITVPLTLLNNGTMPWISSRESHYFLSYHLKYFVEGYDTNEMFLGARSPLPQFIGPGELVEAELRIAPPEKQGAYYIAVDIGRGSEGDDESVYWFSREGWRTTDYLVEVEGR